MTAKKSDDDESREVEVEQRRIENVDFILNHLSGTLFPRRISTAATKGAQFTVYDKDEMIKAYTKADWINCRVSAYPLLSDAEFCGRSRKQAPDFLFIDLDIGPSKNEEEHRRALKETLRNIKRQFGGYPTVLWSGNGYHVYQPMHALILEDVADFIKFEQPSIKFLRFAERQLSNNKCDPAHNPSFKSCMIRLPGSLNAKCIAKGLESKAGAEVKIIQNWNGLRPKIPYQFYKDFLAYLVKERKEELQRLARHCKNTTNSITSQIPWIETLLQTPIEDYRKHALDLIIAPYLIVVRRLSSEQALRIIEVWLDKCNKVRRLDFDPRYKIKTALKNVSKSNIPPMKLETLKQRNSELHKIIAKTQDNRYI